MFMIDYWLFMMIKEFEDFMILKSKARKAFEDKG